MVIVAVGFTYEYSFGVRRIEDQAAWVPRVFDPDEPGSIDMWLGPTRRVSSQPQRQEQTPDAERNRDGVHHQHAEPVFSSEPPF